MWIKFAAATCLFAFPLLAGIPEVESEIQKISDSETCLNTLKSLIEEALLTTESEKGRDEVNTLLEAIEYWRLTSTRDLPSIAWGLHQCFIKTYLLLHGLEIEIHKQFLQNGYRQGVVDEELNQNFLQAFQEVKALPFSLDDCDPNYLATDLNPDTIHFLNQSHIYVQLSSLQLDALRPILVSLKEQVTECIGTPWRIASVRAWKTLPSHGETGPNSWHTDGCPFSALKIMYYPRGVSPEKGTVELQFPDGIYSLEEEAGTWMLFKNSEILHRGRPPQVGERIAVEITILPSLTYDLAPICAGQNARHPILPWQTKGKE